MARKERMADRRSGGSQLVLRGRRSGVAVLLVLAVLSVTLGISYALSRRSVTAAAMAQHESGGIQARSAVGAAVALPLQNLRGDPNWLPKGGIAAGSFAPNEAHRVDLGIGGEGGERSLAASALIFDLASHTDGQTGATGNAIDPRPLADQRLQIRLTKQTRNDLPTAAITAFETAVNEGNDAPIYIAQGSTVRGNVRSNGPIYFEHGFALDGSARMLGDVSRAGTESKHYVTYRASWGTSYPAQSLGKPGDDNHETLQLSNVTLLPSNSNPMGVYHFSGDELILNDNVNLAGTLVTRGHITIRGSSIHLSGLRYAYVPDPSSSLPTRQIIRPLSDRDRNTTDNGFVRTTFPVIVADCGIDIVPTADTVRISGLVVTPATFIRQSKFDGTLVCKHDHAEPLSEQNKPLLSSDGPAVYIQGAVMAGRVRLEHRGERPFAIAFDSEAVDVRDAPGFFTWRVADWTESN